MRRRSLPLALAAAAALACGVAPAAQADSVRTDAERAASEGQCAAPAVGQPLAPLGDARSYFTAPGGDFESAELEGWTLRDGARVVPGGIGLSAGGSLFIPRGGSAMSAAFCVDLDHPSFRLFAARVDAEDDRNASLAIDVIYPDASKNVRETTRLEAPGDAGLSRDVALAPELAGASAGARKVVLRFRATGNDSWLIDDVLVDPRMRS